MDFPIKHGGFFHSYVTVYQRGIRVFPFKFGNQALRLTSCGMMVFVWWEIIPTICYPLVNIQKTIAMSQSVTNYQAGWPHGQWYVSGLAFVVKRRPGYGIPRTHSSVDIVGAIWKGGVNLLHGLYMPRIHGFWEKHLSFMVGVVYNQVNSGY